MGSVTDENDDEEIAAKLPVKNFKSIDDWRQFFLGPIIVTALLVLTKTDSNFNKHSAKHLGLLPHSVFMSLEKCFQAGSKVFPGG